MAKIALLIGVSDYGEGLSGLPRTQEDIQVMQRVLQNPQVGGFDSVEVMPNPDRTQMESEIETLFTENRGRDDLILLYFSGHGVRTDDGTLYLANRTTTKNPQGRIRTSTAISATTLQDYMSRSKSKRQVVILDCCFSGAFANDMKAKGAVDELVDVQAQLGGEGRVVLTSSTATQVSYEKEGTSIYTRYLVEGLETGAADRDRSGQITIDELHDYAKEKVQEAAPTMQPEIYAVKEGYKIVLACAPQGDPRLIYRKAFDERAKQKRGKLSPIDQRALNRICKELGLSSQEAEQIALQVLQPYQEYWAKLEEFKQAVKETLEGDPQLSVTSQDDLQYFQRVLKLRDEDVNPILNSYYLLENTSSPQTPTTSSPPENFEHQFLKAINELPSGSGDKQLAEKMSLDIETIRDHLQLAKQQRYVDYADTKDGYSSVELTPQGRKKLEELSTQAKPEDLSSEKGIDYTRLRNLLEARDWKNADYETYLRMLEAVEREKGSLIQVKELENFPCTDLKIIDSLWMKYSNNIFGFSVQKQIYIECGGNLDSFHRSDKPWEKFGDRVGWCKSGNWLPYNTLECFSLIKGRLPFRFCVYSDSNSVGIALNGLFFSLVSRLVDCSKSQS